MFINNRFVAGLLAGTAALLATAAHAQKLTAYDKAFLIKLDQGNHAEIAAGKIALQNSKDPKVRGVAQTIISDHTANEQKLQTLATKYNVRLPMRPDPMHKAMAKKLSRMGGNAFDNAYITGQMKDHHKTIDILRLEMTKGKNSEVRSYAADTLGAVLAHTDTIHKVSGTSANMMMMKKHNSK